MTMTSHKTYYELFRDSAAGPIAANDIVAVNTKIYEQFTSAEKSDFELLDFIHQLFEDCIGGLAMILLDSDGVHRVHLIHGIRCFLPGITGLLHPSPHQHSTFGYLDDVEEGGDATLIKLNSDLLAFTEDVRVRSQEQHKDALTASTNNNPLPALGDLAPQTKVIKVRKLMFVPFPVMRVLLEKNFSPRQAFLAIYTFLESNNVL